MEIKTERARAKLNLHLEVLNRRTDNYHNIFSIMCELEMADLLKLEFYELYTDSDFIDIQISNGGGEYSDILETVPVTENLVTSAVTRYLKSNNLGGRFGFILEKNIPYGAGLGGGSSDAAAALRILKELTGERNPGSYFNTAVETGSDVPFFLTGGAAFVEKRGEVVEKINFSPGFHVVLVNNGIHVNTGYAYRELKREYGVDPSGSYREEKRGRLSRYIECSPEEWNREFKNDFEEVIFKLYPELEQLKREFYEKGAAFSAMTGSGSTVFGVFKDKEGAIEAYNAFIRKNQRCFFTKFAP